MNTTRTGKIARLSLNIREKLNVLLDNNQPGPAILEWINNFPETREVLEKFFDGRPISEQNLSEWRKGGYEDWLRLQEARRIAAAMREEGGQLDADLHRESLSEHLSTVLSVELAVRAKARLAEAATEDERWKRLVEIMRELDRLRRSDQRASRLRLECEKARFDLTCRKEEESRAARKRKIGEEHLMLNARKTQSEVAEKLGETAEAYRTAALYAELQWGLELESLGRVTDESFAEIAARYPIIDEDEDEDQAPNPHAPTAPGRDGALRRPQPAGTASPSSPQPTPPDAAQYPSNPTESKQIKPLNPSDRTAAACPPKLAKAGPLSVPPRTGNDPQPQDARNPVDPAPQPTPPDATQRPANPAKSNQIKPLNPPTP